MLFEGILGPHLHLPRMLRIPKLADIFPFTARSPFGGSYMPQEDALVPEQKECTGKHILDRVSPEALLSR